MTNVEHIHERSAAYGIPGMFIEDGNNVLDAAKDSKRLWSMFAVVKDLS